MVVNLSGRACAVIAGFLDPEVNDDEILAGEDVWAEVRAAFPPKLYRDALNEEGEIVDEFGDP